MKPRFAGISRAASGKFTTLQHGVQGFIRHTRNVRIFTQRNFCARNRNKQRNAPVVDLRSGRCPTAVRRFIIPVNIDTVERHAARSRAHVRQKGDGIVRPSFAHRDAPAAIFGIFRVTLVETTRFGAAPRRQFNCSFAPDGASMSQRTGGDLLIPIAAATHLPAGTNVVERRNQSGSTVASETPLRMPLPRQSDALNADEPAISDTCDVDRNHYA